MQKKDNSIENLDYEDLINVDGIAFSRKKFVSQANTLKASNS